MAFDHSAVDDRTDGRSVMGGVPCLRGTQVPVSVIVGRIAEGSSMDEIIEDYPQVSKEDVVAAAEFATAAVDLRELPLLGPTSRPYATNTDARRRRIGRTHPRGKLETLSSELVVAADAVAAELQLPYGGWAVRRRQLTVDGGRPVELSTSWIDGRLADGALQLRELTTAGDDTVASLERVTGRRATTSRDVITVRHASAEERRLLRLAGSRPPVVVARHLVADAERQPMALVEVVYVPERWAVRMSNPPKLSNRASPRVRTAKASQPRRVPEWQPGRTMAASKGWLGEHGAWVVLCLLVLVFIAAVTVLALAPVLWTSA